ncbi:MULTISPECIES: hypothetical protein [Lysobacter]|uniref:hypothetical protein n=1 Tax=Lysobacter TaxID=68 RepID=UPI001F349B4F|nr:MULTISPECIES: hypothetical protein [Lysobacter]UJB17601.1 hypothetical protein L1A79_14615 [Lysobacter capsici]UJQ28677.1 hypothetical protein L2D09_00255 [Lysobacter gummosus]
MTNKAASRPSDIKVTWAQAVRDIVVASINKGQLPVLSLSAVLLLIVYRMPVDKVAELAFKLIEHLQSGAITGWLLMVLVTGGWFFHSKHMIKQFKSEHDRIGQEKSQLQHQAAGEKFPSSRTKK